MGQERVTISINSAILKQIDALVNKKTVRNRSHAIESLILQGLPKTNVTQGVVLVGGEGTADALPAITDTMIELHARGVTQFIVIYGYYGRAIKARLGHTQLSEQTIVYHHTELGSGGGLRDIVDQLQSLFFLINLTRYKFVNWELLGRYHQRFQPIVTLWPQEPGSYHGVAIAQKSLLDLTPSGFCILERDILPEVTTKQELILVPTGEL